MSGGRKNFLDLEGTPVLARTLEVFEGCAVVDRVVCVVRAGDVEYVKDEIVGKYGLGKVFNVIAGGAERQDSIYKALGEIDGDRAVIVVHDGARPFVTRDVIERTAYAAFERGAAVAAVLLKDTIKEVARDLVASTVDRHTLRSVQTPQAFRTELLKRAYERAMAEGFYATDDSALVERLGEEVVVVEGSYENIKITTDEDLLFAEAIVRSRKRAARG